MCECLSCIYCCYCSRLVRYFSIQFRESVAYAFYAALYIIMPYTVTIVVLWFGGLLVLRGQLTPSGLFAFMLYQTNLSSSFQAIGDVSSGFAAALGTADKVFQIMDRRPQVKPRTLILYHALSTLDP